MLVAAHLENLKESIADELIALVRDFNKLKDLFQEVTGHEC